MPISFEKAVALLKEHNITTYTFKKSGVLAQGTLTKLRRNQCITTDSIGALCKLLHCQPGDLMEYIPDEADQELPLGEAGREAD